MKTNLFVIITFLMTLACKGMQNRQETRPDHGLLWEITGNGIQSPSYLFGTFHGPGGMSILDSIQSFDSLFFSTEQLICEMELKNAVALLLEKSNSTSKSNVKPWPVADSTYVNLLTDKQKIILDLAINADQSLKVIKELNLRPLQAVNFIRYSYKKKAENSKLLHSKTNSVDDSIRTIVLDVYLQQQATKYNMTIVELDSKDEYRTVSDSINSCLPQLSYTSEVEYLMFYIQNHQEIDSLQNDLTDKLLSTYLKQDICLVELQQKERIKNNNMIVAFLGLENCIELQHKMLIDERNNLWMNKIPHLIKNNASFIAVGAGHLAGENGLINQLRNLNYSVVPVKKTME
jgi:uncharacterized protein YbaP (TraB family)